MVNSSRLSGSTWYFLASINLVIPSCSIWLLLAQTVVLPQWISGEVTVLKNICRLHNHEDLKIYMVLFLYNYSLSFIMVIKVMAQFLC